MSRWDRIKRLPEHAIATVRDGTRGASVPRIVSRQQLERTSAALLPVGLIALVAYVSWRFGGPITTVLYTLLFLTGLLLIPTSIYLGGPSFPGGLRKLFGKLQWILGAVAYDVPFLVQHETGWKLHPGRTRTDPDGHEGYEVQINGDWHPIEGGITNMTVLGWRPFGILRWKSDRTLVDARADIVAENKRADIMIGDGGSGQTERGGYVERKMPGISGRDGRWLVDLKRVYSVGVQMIGDIEILERTEEVMARKDAQEGAFSGWEPIIATAIGLVLGVGTAYMMLAA